MIPLEQALPPLWRAIDDVLIASHGIRARLPDGAPGFDLSPAEAIAFYGGPCAAFDLWTVLAAIDRLARAWTQ